MPEVRWSRRAEVKLRAIGPAVRAQLTSNAGKILHYIPPVVFKHDEGFEGDVMWHRGIACGMSSEELLAHEDDDGPWNYFFLYRPGRSGPEGRAPARYFEILDLRRISVADVGEQWEKMKGEAS
jgi:hypothetical protein